jgi:hypothetical protein
VENKVVMHGGVWLGAFVSGKIDLSTVVWVPSGNFMAMARKSHSGRITVFAPFPLN